MKETTVCAVIDTNVLVSALFSPDGLSNPARVIRAVVNGVITPLYKDGIIAEYRDVLSRPKFNFEPALIDKFLSVFTTFGINIDHTNPAEEKFPDMDDVIFYEVAMSVDDAYLVTGNTRHFPDKPFVVTPSRMMKILRDMGLAE